MGYKNAICILPDDLIMAIQQHIDGEYLYIPRKEENKKGWGELSKAMQPFLQNTNVVHLLSSWQIRSICRPRPYTRYYPK